MLSVGGFLDDLRLSLSAYGSYTIRRSEATPVRAPTIITIGYLTAGLETLSADFEDELGTAIGFMIDETDTERVDELRAVAAEETKTYGEPAFRFFQILEQLR